MASVPPRTHWRSCLTVHRLLTAVGPRNASSSAWTAPPALELRLVCKNQRSVGAGVGFGSHEQNQPKRRSNLNGVVCVCVYACVVAWVGGGEGGGGGVGRTHVCTGLDEQTEGLRLLPWTTVAPSSDEDWRRLYYVMSAPCPASGARGGDSDLGGLAGLDVSADVLHASYWRPAQSSW